MPPAAYGYTRVSTSEQADSGAGLEDQRRAIANECERRGWALAHIYSDSNGVSGGTLRRPALTEALQALSERRAEVLVASKLDRLSRSVLDFASLMAQADREGWSIVVLDVAVDTSTPSGEMMANVVAAFAQYERRLISQRTKDALAVKRSQGVVLGRPRSIPSGVRERIVAMRADGLSYRAIAEALNADGVARGQRGDRWYASTVRSTMLSEYPKLRVGTGGHGPSTGACDCGTFYNHEGTIEAWYAHVCESETTAARQGR
jgi:DNA invertase Pin-like site-specific DNA recombinase